MTIEQKKKFFRELLKCGIKEIEVAFPAASETDFRFVRGLVESNEVPDDVWMQVSGLRSSTSIILKKFRDRFSHLRGRT
jgi:isopropylmalate/homocitrate/citramalate synthase